MNRNGSNNNMNNRGGQNGIGGGNNGIGPPSSRGHSNNNNNYNQRAAREFHSSSSRTARHSTSFSDIKMGFIKPLTTWRNLTKRQEALQYDKMKALKDLEMRQEEAENMALSRFHDFLVKERESIRVKVKERDAVREKEAELKVERELRSHSPEKLKKISKREEELKRRKDRLLDSLSDLEELLVDGENKLKKEMAEEKENFDIEKSNLVEKFGAQERKLDIEITRFLQDTENQWFEMERRMRYSPMALEQELIKHKATVQYLNDVVEDLENRNMIQIEQMQQISAECTFEKARIVHQYELNKQTLITQAKYEGYLQGMNQLYQPGPHDTDNNHMNGNLQDFMSTNNESSSARFTAQLQSSLLHQKKIPNYGSSACKPMNGTELTDIRDRYEEFKAHAWASMKEEQFNWTLSMIQKIVSYYEAIGMKVYEEVVPNKYVSTLLWCPKNNLFPNRTDSIFATGHGDTKDEATENAIQWAYSYVQTIISNTNNRSRTESRESVIAQNVEEMNAFSEISQEDSQSESDTLCSTSSTPTPTQEIETEVNKLTKDRTKVISSDSDSPGHYEFPNTLCPENQLDKCITSVADTNEIIPVSEDIILERSCAAANKVVSEDPKSNTTTPNSSSDAVVA